MIDPETTVGGLGGLLTGGIRDQDVAVWQKAA